MKFFAWFVEENCSAWKAILLHIVCIIMIYAKLILSRHTNFLVEQKKTKSLVRGAEMKNIVYALELQCNSCIYFSYLCWQVVPLWEMGRECCCPKSSDGIYTPCLEQACTLPASILGILALLKLWMWSIFELFFAYCLHNVAIPVSRIEWSNNRQKQ